MPTIFIISVSYIRKIAGHRLVPVEIGLKYTDDNWGQQLTTINDFIDSYVESPLPGKHGYLAQHQLFDQVSGLLGGLLNNILSID